ncbi:solute carrier family 25 protein [Drepanopeziza brunnea f. sp. 'multigermtubi' MB_m1]|uniref:Solute carrier family 25 protein n=1 Tax=Marssonina brunnea f. sp. multigermtubi (strain MB_m1) TaxID=1072389 RepID=K1WCG4_MARBU|nr:solute carrier family 25 protein [Drepanopeziza brunnea f. sp. 'multigermtubi' MB_m1]EKD15055.1 solute carrier family 25 protein [Drepanopeziza brunnea f. sp. 'multigermtubi' MB_m1]
MAPPPPPTAMDKLCAKYQSPILMGTFALQVAHHQYIRRTTPTYEPLSSTFPRLASVPRPLRAGLGWAAIFLGLLTQITLAKRSIRDSSGPVLPVSAQRKHWVKKSEEALHLWRSLLYIFYAMSADFWAGYISGAAGILIGNPLDLIKVRLQASPALSTPSLSTGVPLPPSSYRTQFQSASSLIRGATAPIIGYGALNALLFVTYNRTSTLLNSQSPSSPSNLWTTWIAGAIGGLATWVISTPTEIVKCRAQISTTSAAASSWGITKEILRTEGVRGLYFGGVVTALRDSVGYGFYFWSYELTTRFMVQKMKERGEAGTRLEEAAKVLLCGGIAGVVTWASIFPLDVIKTRVQTQQAVVIRVSSPGEAAPLLAGEATGSQRLGAVAIARNAYRSEGVGVFFRGLGVCSTRAFVVNAAQWAVYEWIVRELEPQRKDELNSSKIEGRDVGI